MRCIEHFYYSLLLAARIVQTYCLPVASRYCSRHDLNSSLQVRLSRRYFILEDCGGGRALSNTTKTPSSVLRVREEQQRYKKKVSFQFNLQKINCVFNEYKSWSRCSRASSSSKPLSTLPLPPPWRARSISLSFYAALASSSEPAIK